MELVSFAAAQVREGKTSLADFKANRGNKTVDEAIQLAKKFTEDEARYIRSKKSCIEVLEDELGGECRSDCEGRWLNAAKEILQ